MNFKLLTPKPEAGQEQQARNALRVKELADAEQEQRIKLAKSQADFSATLAKNRERWAQEEEEHATRKKEMKAEIDVLEIDKLNMLVPFNILKEGTDDRFRDAETFLQGLRKREEDVERITELLEERLDEAGEKIQNADNEAKRQQIALLGIKNQQESIRAQSEQLTLHIAEFGSEKARIERDLEARKTAVVLKERSQISKDEELKRQEQSLKDLAIRLRDERDLLDQAWKQVKNKS